MKEQISLHYWPAIRRDINTTKIEFQTIHNDNPGRVTEANLKEAEPFIKASEASTEDIVEVAKDSGQVARNTFKFKIPKTTEDCSVNHGEKFVTAELSVYRSHKKFENANTIALTRGFGMVVHYYNSGAIEQITNDHQGDYFYGVLKIGEALGESEMHKHAEMFMKSTEGPLHDRWLVPDMNYNHVGKYYDRPTTSINTFYSELTKTFKKLCGAPKTSNTSDCKHLAGVFLFGKKIQIAKPRLSLTNMTGNYINSGDKWEISGNAVVNRRVEDEGDEWRAKIGFFIAQEDNKTNIKVPLDVTSFIVEEEDKVSYELEDDNLHVKVKTTGLEKFSFNAILDVDKSVALNKLLETTDIDKTELTMGYGITSYD